MPHVPVRYCEAAAGSGKGSDKGRKEGGGEDEARVSVAPSLNPFPAQSSMIQRT